VIVLAAWAMHMTVAMIVPVLMFVIVAMVV